MPQNLATSFERNSCRLCHSAELRKVVPLAPTPVAEKYLEQPENADQVPVHPLDLYMCHHCGHVQLLHIIDPEFLYRDFNYRSAGTPALVRHFDEVADIISTHYRFAHSPLAVDIGSNDGSLLQCYKNRGFRVLGVDPARDIAAEASAAGIPTLPEFLTRDSVGQILEQQGPASVVCAFNVFAHTDDLEGMTTCIRDLLAPDGIFVFECSYLGDILEKKLLGTIFHEHLSHHSVTPLAAFLSRLGLELIDVRRNTIQGGSIVGIAQKADGRHPVQSSVRKILAEEDHQGLTTPETIEQFSHFLSNARKNISSFIQHQKSLGNCFWGFGAARSGTTLITQLDLGDAIERIVDDNPAKQGKFTPLHGIPVVPTRFLYEEMPEFTFILAWIHSDTIIAAHKQYLEAGGRFVVCFPELKIIGALGASPL
jgi:SAM-dependent methyltransferase